jgi:hypothetical protein
LSASWCRAASASTARQKFGPRFSDHVAGEHDRSGAAGLATPSRPSGDRAYVGDRGTCGHRSSDPPGEGRAAHRPRGQAVLLMVAGVSVRDAARAVGANARTVGRWRKRFAEADDPVAKLADAPRSGRPPSLSRTPMPRG